MLTYFSKIESIRKKKTRYLILLIFIAQLLRTRIYCSIFIVAILGRMGCYLPEM